MQPSTQSPRTSQHSWTYATLTVVDGQRRLKPTHAAFDRLHFTQPPRLTSTEIAIILTNGPDKQRHTATVLPHEPDATRIPIRLTGQMTTDAADCRMLHAPPALSTE